MGGITIAFREELVTVSTRDNLLAAVWRGPPSVEQLKRLRQVGITLAERHPQGTLFVNIMLTGNARFSSEARAEAAKQTAENAMGATAGAHVIAAEGLVAATVRAFISTVLMLSRPSRPTKVFANIKEAAPWLVAHAPPGELHWDEAKLVALYDELVAEA